MIVGRRVNEDTYTVQLDRRRTSGSCRSTKRELREYSIGDASTMPSFANVFDEDECADLVAYLLSLKGTK